MNAGDLTKVDEVRFMNPLKLAEKLEIPAQDLSQYMSTKGEELIRLIKRNKENDPIHFYKRQGFKKLKERKKGTTPMYFDLVNDFELSF